MKYLRVKIFTQYEIKVFVRKELGASLGVENTQGIAFVGKGWVYFVRKYLRVKLYVQKKRSKFWWEIMHSQHSYLLIINKIIRIKSNQHSFIFIFFKGANWNLTGMSKNHWSEWAEITSNLDLWTLQKLNKSLYFFPSFHIGCFGNMFMCACVFGVSESIFLIFLKSHHQPLVLYYVWLVSYLFT